MMNSLDQLKATTNLHELARLPGYQPKALSYILYQLTDVEKYHIFEIPKKSGGTRTIHAPCPELSLLQRKLGKLLANCVHDILDKQPLFWNASHGFRPQRTILSNASVHRNKKYVFNVDIINFFGSLNFGRVRGFFIKDKYFALEPPVATIIAQIACFNNQLPQGSPCSPVISNLVGNILDMRLVSLARTQKCTYTRYADDLTFSTNQSDFPNSIGSKQIDGTWIAGTSLTSMVNRTGFSLNLAKTRMSLRHQRQTVTGLVVNKKPNIDQYYYRSARAMCHRLFKEGAFYLSDQSDGPPPNLNVLEGMLNHICFVKGRRDRTSEQNKRANFSSPKSPDRLYKRFLFYKNFVSHTRPVIITEGISDIIYLEAAIRALSKDYPLLVTNHEGKKKLNVRLFNPVGTQANLLNLDRGVSGQATFLENFKSELRKYRHKPLEHPIILLCDNDKGLKALTYKIKRNKIFTGKIDSRTTEKFYHFGENLYLVKVPEGSPARERDIEDLFPQTWLDKTIGGKTFDKSKSHDAPSAYGKVIFANKIVTPNAAKIDFTLFGRLLERIEASIQHHKGLER